MEFFDYRLFFTKTGDLKYISHLDLNRFMQRSLTRTGLPLWYTEGFNPHPYVTFALPLSLLQESVYECMDFRLKERCEPARVAAALGVVLPSGLAVLRVAPPRQKASAITAAAYRLCLPGLGERLEEAASFLARPEIPVIKHTKKGGDRPLNVSPLLRNCTCRAVEQDLEITLTLPAGSEQTVNPTLLLTALLGELHEEVPPRITRTAIFTEGDQLFD